jgi:hypothetical protein
VEVLKLCAIYTSIYVFARTIAFSFVFERWTIIDSIYFSVSLFTTCGYGDLQQTSEAGQIFTIFFAIYGVLTLGIFIGIVGHAISEGQKRARKAMRKEKQTEILQTLFTIPRGKLEVGERANAMLFSRRDFSTTRKRSWTTSRKLCEQSFQKSW